MVWICCLGNVQYGPLNVQSIKDSNKTALLGRAWSREQHRLSAPDPALTFPFLHVAFGVSVTPLRTYKSHYLQTTPDSDFGSKALKVRLSEIFYNAVDTAMYL